MSTLLRAGLLQGSPSSLLTVGTSQREHGRAKPQKMEVRTEASSPQQAKSVCSCSKTEEKTPAQFIFPLSSTSPQEYYFPRGLESQVLLKEMRFYFCPWS